MKRALTFSFQLVTHGGLGYPRNLNTGRSLEEQVRKQGAIPATIAIFGGYIRVGLEPHELELLAKTDQAIKCSRRDLGAAVALKWTGSTTVAATMFAAHAGRRYFSFCFLLSSFLLTYLLCY
jgi:pseudouridine-5'-phosphate glycosidase